ncbi:serpin family protein, partial [Candidatus Woesearchaeota archaeon]|nr:serpin family protein [Candidatus Woesearchaeota archaeon]
MGTENKPKSSALESVVGANNRFALDLYMQYSSKDENIFFSPYSISTALAMTYEGAKGKTANEMKEVFHFPAKKALREGSAKLMADINSGEKDYRLNTANALWAEKDYEFIKKYFNTVEKHYGGKVSNMDFKNNYEGERQLINKWVEEKTFEKIKDLIPQG